MNIGDIFYSVMQKDNCPFEKPRITKFVVEKIFNDNCTHPIVSTKTDKWGRHYCFKENQIYSTYEDAIPEKNEKLEKIKQWEKERVEWSLKVAEEQRKREELEKNLKTIECLEDVRKTIGKRLQEKQLKWGDKIMVGSFCNSVNDVIDQKISELKGE